MALLGGGGTNRFLADRTSYFEPVALSSSLMVAFGTAVRSVFANLKTERIIGYARSREIVSVTIERQLASVQPVGGSFGYGSMTCRASLQSPLGFLGPSQNELAN